MKPYEGLFIFPPESGPEARKTQFKNLDDLFAKVGASAVNKQEFGKRSLGYPVRKFHEGYLVVADFKLDPAKVDEFRKALLLQDELLKFTLIYKPVVKAPEKKASSDKSAATRPAAKSHTGAEAATTPSS